MARDLGVSHTYLSLMLSGKRKFPPKRVLQISKQLGIEAKEVSGYMAAALNVPSHIPDKKTSPTQQYIRMELDRYRILSEWYHLPLLDLTLVKGFRSEPKWISRQLGIPVKKVEGAIRRLLRLGLLNKDSGRFKKTQVKIAFPTHSSLQAIRKFHREMILKGLDALQSPRQADFDSRDITGITMPVNSRRISEARKRIQKFRRQLYAFLSQGECDRLYQLNVQLFPLTPPQEERRKRG